MGGPVFFFSGTSDLEPFDRPLLDELLGLWVCEVVVARNRWAVSAAWVPPPVRMPLVSKHTPPAQIRIYLERLVVLLLQRAVLVLSRGCGDWA